MKIKVKLIKKNKPISYDNIKIGSFVYCHTLLHMQDNPKDIRCIPGRVYKVVNIQLDRFGIEDEAGKIDKTTVHWFEFYDCDRWFCLNK